MSSGAVRSGLGGDAIPVPPEEGGCVLWHRRNLRLSDHPALGYAAREYGTLLPLFVFDPAFYGPDGLACDARIEFLHDSLESLAGLYDAAGGTLSFAHGGSVGILHQLRRAGWDIVAMADPTARYGRHRDEKAIERCDVTFVDGDGLVRGRTWSRDGWEDHIEAWFEAEQARWDPEGVGFRSLGSQVGIAEVESAYDVDATKSKVHRGEVPRGPEASDVRRGDRVLPR